MFGRGTEFKLRLTLLRMTGPIFNHPSIWWCYSFHCPIEPRIPPVTMHSTAKIQVFSWYGHSKPRGTRQSLCRYMQVTPLCYSTLLHFCVQAMQWSMWDLRARLLLWDLRQCLHLQELKGQTEQRSGMTGSNTFTNKNTALIDLILVLPAISLPKKRNKIHVQLTSKRNFCCTSKVSFLIGMALDQDNEGAAWSLILWNTLKKLRDWVSI